MTPMSQGLDVALIVVLNWSAGRNRSGLCWQATRRGISRPPMRPRRVRPWPGILGRGRAFGARPGRLKRRDSVGKLREVVTHLHPPFGSRAMQQFIKRHQKDIFGVLNGFDRIRFRGTIRWFGSVRGVMSFLWELQVRLTQFTEWAKGLTRQIVDASEDIAKKAGCPMTYLYSSSES